MKTCILFPGKIKPKVLAAAQEEYVRRLRSFGIDVVEYRDEKIASRTPELVRHAEAERIVKLLKEGDFLVACDERGQGVTTAELTDFLRTARSGDHLFAGRRRIVIVIGGALGLSDSIRKRADAVWSLSSLVMAGGIARVVLLEGIYRAFTVLEGHPYHNE
jgi:23S rRNA (pseudouridine1915-N3)-methyltransferase